MERLKTLVDKLNNGISENSAVADLMATVKMIEAELLSQVHTENAATNGSAVTVLAPAVFILNGNGRHGSETLAQTADAFVNKDVEQPDVEQLPVVENASPTPEPVMNTLPQTEENVAVIPSGEDVVNDPEPENISVMPPAEEVTQTDNRLTVTPPSEKVPAPIEEKSPVAQTPEPPQKLAPPQEIYRNQPVQQETKPDPGPAVPNTGTKEPDKIVEELIMDDAEIEAELDQIKEKAESINKISGHMNPILTLDFDTEIPTFAQQEPVAPPSPAPQAATETKEVHEIVGQGADVSVNEKLRTANTEVAAQLADQTPIKDLRKAISINDKFNFVNELFRGDEAMYNRSIKTINNFSIYPEAEFWIRRELKLKLGWDEKSEPVKLFDQFVRRRFS